MPTPEIAVERRIVRWRNSRSCVLPKKRWCPFPPEPLMPVAITRVSSTDRASFRDLGDSRKSLSFQAVARHLPGPGVGTCGVLATPLWHHGRTARLRQPVFESGSSAPEGGVRQVSEAANSIGIPAVSRAQTRISGFTVGISRRLLDARQGTSPDSIAAAGEGAAVDAQQLRGGALVAAGHADDPADVAALHRFEVEWLRARGGRRAAHHSH